MLSIKSPARLDYTVVQGNSFQDSFTLKVNGAAYDLTDHTARLQGKVNVADTEFTVDLSTDNGKLTLGGGTGMVTYSETPANVRAWGTEPIEYQFELEDAGGNVQTLFVGVITPIVEIAL